MTNFSCHSKFTRICLLKYLMLLKFLFVKRSYWITPFSCNLNIITLSSLDSWRHTEQCVGIIRWKEKAAALQRRFCVHIHEPAPAPNRQQVWSNWWLVPKSDSLPELEREAGSEGLMRVKTPFRSLVVCIYIYTIFTKFVYKLYQSIPYNKLKLSQYRINPCFQWKLYYLNSVPSLFPLKWVIRMVSSLFKRATFWSDSVPGPRMGPSFIQAKRFRGREASGHQLASQLISWLQVCNQRVTFWKFDVLLVEMNKAYHVR